MRLYPQPIQPEDENRVEYLRFKHENGLLYRRYDILTGSDVTTSYIFQEDPAVDPVVGDEALRCRVINLGSDNQQILYDVVVLTQEIIDFTDPIDNLAPTDIALSNSTVSEVEGIGTTIGILSTFDPNAGDTHNYSITVDADDKFEISGNLLRTKNLLDYDTATSHLVTIRSTDQGALFFDKQFQIFVQEQVGFANEKATIFQGDTIDMDMSGPAANTILPSNGSFTLSTWIKKNNPTPTTPPPLTITGLELWLDADDDTTITESGGLISQWDDKSGSANHATQATGANQPTVMASGYGNRATVAFDDPEYLQTTYATIQTTTIFAVFKHNHLGVQPSGPVWMLDSSAADTGFYPKWVDSNQYVGITGTSWMSKATEFVNEQFYITAVVYDSSAPSSELFVDGVSNDSATSVEKAGIDFTIGRRLTDNANFKGEVAEILIYNKVLNTTEREAIEDYLNNKWVLGNEIDAEKTLLDFGNMKLTYNQADIYKFHYLNVATPMVLVSQNVNYGDNTYHQIQIGYDSVAQSIHLHADGTTPTMESGVVLPARDSSTVRIAGDSAQVDFLDATVDEISAYNSHVDVTELYNEGYSQDLLDNPSLPTPRLWLRMGDPADNYINASGILDRSGNGFHFTANNMSGSNCINDGVLTKPIYANEKSLTLDGINQSADTGVTTDLSGSGDFSASIWYKGTAASYIMSQAHTLGPYSSDWIIGGGGAIFWMRTKTLGSLATINDGEWHNMILSWDSTAETYEGFVDGASIGTSTAVSGYGGTGPVAIGTRGDFTTSFTAGLVDEPSLWNKKLVIADAIEVWNAGPPADLEEHSSFVNVINHWRCGEDTGDDVNGMVDQIGNSDATLNNYITDPYSTDVPT